MARTLNPVAHALRRDAFIDAAVGLIQTRGYEQMSIQDVLVELDTSRGAFYHYFDSKAALLEAVVERTVEVATAELAPVADDPDRSALQKLEGVFGGLARWKAQRKELMLALMRVWLSDENAIMREKFRQLTAIRLTPLLAKIVRQGNAEGVFRTASAEHVAAVFVSLVLGANETASRLFVAFQAGDISIENVERTLAAYVEAFERILGLAPGSWPVDYTGTLREWFA